MRCRAHTRRTVCCRRVLFNNALQGFNINCGLFLAPAEQHGIIQCFGCATDAHFAADIVIGIDILFRIQPVLLNFVITGQHLNQLAPAVRHRHNLAHGATRPATDIARRNRTAILAIGVGVMHYLAITAQIFCPCVTCAVQHHVNIGDIHPNGLRHNQRVVQFVQHVFIRVKEIQCLLLERFRTLGPGAIVAPVVASGILERIFHGGAYFL